MIKYCEGCEYEFEEALFWQKQGYYYATSLEREYNERRHFALYIVDKNGKVIMW